MESDDPEIDDEAELRHRALWFRVWWRCMEWRRQRILRRLYRNPELAREYWTPPE